VPVTGDPEGYRLAFEEGRSAVAEQAASLRELRDRAGTLVSIAGLVAGVGVTVILDDGRGQRADEVGVAGGVVAAVGFAAVVWSVVQIWRPMPGRYVRDAGVLVGSYVEGDPPAGLAELHRELALHLGRHTLALRDELEGRYNHYTRALWALLILLGGLMLMVLDVSR
jgi:hypothetical protein